MLLESGGETSDAATQTLYAGENVGLDHVPLDAARSRFLGGSSNCWGGWCRPLDPIDFEARSWMPALLPARPHAAGARTLRVF
ncbi:MAG: hypothetical protein ACR2KU_10315 [Gammaproteobacteria bacterium]